MCFLCIKCVILTRNILFEIKLDIEGQEKKLSKNDTVLILERSNIGCMKNTGSRDNGTKVIIPFTLTKS